MSDKEFIINMLSKHLKDFILYDICGIHDDIIIIAKHNTFYSDNMIKMIKKSDKDENNPYIKYKV